MKKRISALLLSGLLCISCIPVSSAAITHQIYVHDGVQDCGLKAGEDGSGKGWSYDGSTDTLTLNGFDGKYILFMNEFTENDLTIVLNGQNKVTWDAVSKPLTGELREVISSYSGIHIKGQGSIDITGEIGATRDITIESGNVSVDDIKVNGTAGINAGALGDVVISGGCITVSSADDESDSVFGDEGVSAKNFRMTAGQLTVKAKVAKAQFYPIHVKQDITINGGEIIADGNLSANYRNGGTISLGTNMKAVGGESKENAKPLSVKNGQFVMADDPYYINLAYVHITSINGSGSTDASTTPTNTVTANPTSSSVLLDGKTVSLDAYEIADNNYFKIRDLASVLSGTNSQFEVTWDVANQAIQLTPGVPYTSVGGELTKGNGQSQPAKVSNAKILLNGAGLDLKAYEINGNTYFKLRDLGEALGFGVDWDSAQNTILIKT